MDAVCVFSQTAPHPPLKPQAQGKIEAWGKTSLRCPTLLWLQELSQGFLRFFFSLLVNLHKFFVLLFPACEIWICHWFWEFEQTCLSTWITTSSHKFAAPTLFLLGAWRPFPAKSCTRTPPPPTHTEPILTLWTKRNSFWQEDYETDLDHPGSSWIIALWIVPSMSRSSSSGPLPGTLRYLPWSVSCH